MTIDQLIEEISSLYSDINDYELEILVARIGELEDILESMGERLSIDESDMLRKMLDKLKDRAYKLKHKNEELSIRRDLEYIYKEALKLMFTNQDNEIDDNDLDDLKSDDNYADYLNNMYGSVNRAIVRLKSKGVEYNGFTYIDENEIEHLDYKLTSSTPGNAKLLIDEELIEFIPYFIKGELYEEDNPTQATIAKNYFEDAVDDYLATKIDTRVEDIYKIM